MKPVTDKGQQMDAEEKIASLEAKLRQHATMINALMSCLGVTLVQDKQGWGYQLNKDVPKDLRGIIVRIVDDIEEIKGNGKSPLILPK